MKRREPPPRLDSLLGSDVRARLEQELPRFLEGCRWFRGKAQRINAAVLADVVRLPSLSDGPTLGLINVEYASGRSEIYVLPLAVAHGARAEEIRSRSPERVVADIDFGSRERARDGLLYDAVIDPQFGRSLLELIEREDHVAGSTGAVRAFATQCFDRLRGPRAETLAPRVLKAEQSNTSIIYGDRLILKLFRRLEPGVNPDLEIGRFLTERSPFANVPPLAGWIDFDPARSSPQNLAILQAFIPSEGDAWSFTLAGLARFLGTARKSPEPARLPRRPLVELAGEQEPDQVAVKHFGDYLAAAGLLGRRVAELHLALLKGTDDPEFMPEPWSAQERRAAHASMLDLLSTVFDLLTNRLASLPDDLRAQAEAVLAGRPRVAARFDEFFKRQPQMLRMRCHGDLHLGQVLYTGKDFVIIDFEGEPARPLSERRCKRTALHDVAGMLRSFHYAAIAAVLEQRRGSLPDHAEAAATTRWASFWQTWSSWAFLRAYLQTMGATPSLPTSRADLRVALDALLIEKAVYEVGYELNNRPEWLGVPLQGISQILDVGSTAA